MNTEKEETVDPGVAPFKPLNVELEVIHLEKINFSMQQNAIPAVKYVYIENHETEDLERVDLMIRSEPEFLHPYTCRIECVPAETKTSFEKPELLMNMEYLASLTEGVSGSIFVSLCKNGETICEKIEKIGVLAYDEWSFTPSQELMAAFVTPNHPAIAKICSDASSLLAQWTGNPSLDGYISADPDRVKKQAAALFGAVQQCNIKYAVPPASYETTGQRVRLCGTILQQRLGTCLDLSFLFASCLEFMGLHPLLVLLKGHCFAGVWLDEKSTFSESVEDDPSLLTKRIAKGVETLVLFECTAATAGNACSFPQAETIAEKNLEDMEKFRVVVDVKRARVNGVKPLP